MNYTTKIGYQTLAIIRADAKVIRKRFSLSIFDCVQIAADQFWSNQDEDKRID